MVLRQRMQNLSFVFFILPFLLLNPFAAQADVLFEGYSKVMSGGVHVGFMVSRYEFDPKKKQFVFTYLMKTNELGGNMLESIKAVSKQDMSPVAYSYTTLAGSETKTIDAKFETEKGVEKISATVKEGAKVSKINKALPKGTFLSYFLVYEMLKNPKGITPETKYDYQAIAEEDGSVVKGMAFVKGLEDYNGVKAYKILNDFKETKFISYVTEKGEVLGAKSPVQSIETILVPQASLATANFQVPTALLKTLFGDVPIGNKNVLAEKAKASGGASASQAPAAAAETPAAKKTDSQ